MTGGCPSCGGLGHSDCPDCDGFNEDCTEGDWCEDCEMCVIQCEECDGTGDRRDDTE